MSLAVVETLQNSSSKEVCIVEDEFKNKLVTKIMLRKNNSKISPEIKKTKKVLKKCKKYGNVVEVIKFEKAIVEKEIYDIIIMKYYEHGDVFTLMDNIPKENEKELKLIFYAMTYAVQQLHFQNIAHMDIKPENLVVDNINSDDNTTFSIKFIDFENVCFWNKKKKLIKVKKGELISGTKFYASPENLQISKNRKIDPFKSDVWSLGICLYLFLTRTFPFSSISQLIEGEIALHPEQLNISNNAYDLLCNMLHTNPNQRYSIEQVLQHPWFWLN